MDEYQHYIRTDAAGIVIYGYTTGFETPIEGDLLLSGQDGRHFQIQLINERGQFIYKLVNGAMTLRDQTELDAEWAARPPAPKTELELLREENESLKLKASQTSTDFQGFMDYFFVKFPE